MLAVKRVLTTFLAVAAIAVSMCFVALSLLLVFTPARVPDDEPLWALGEDDRASLERHVTEFMAAQQQKMPYNKPADWIVDLTQIKREVVRHMLLVDRQNNNELKRQRSISGVSTDGDDPSAFANLLLLAADGGGSDGTKHDEEKGDEEDSLRPPPPSWTARVNTEAFGKRWLSSPWLFKNAANIPSSSVSPTPMPKTAAMEGNDTAAAKNGSSLAASSVPSIIIRTTTTTPPSPASTGEKTIDDDGKTEDQNGRQEMKVDDFLPLLFSAHYERHLLGLSRRRNRLPEEFDVARRWPSCFVNGLVLPSSISNESQWVTNNNNTCGSCWAITAASVIADRLCIARAKHRQQKQQQQQQKGTTATGGQKTLLPGINFTVAADQISLPSVLADQLTECCGDCPNFQRVDEQRGPDFFAPFLHWFKVGLSVSHRNKHLTVNNVSFFPYSRAEMNCSAFEPDKIKRHKAKYVYRLGSIGGEGGFFATTQKTPTNSTAADLPSLFAFHRQWLVENNRRRRLHQHQQQKHEKNSDGGRFGPSATTISNPFYSFQYFNSIADVEQLLRRELMEHGPVMLCLPAFEGLMHYFEGVYDFALQPNELYLHEHCVKVVGWGRRMRPGAKLHWKMLSASAMVQKGKNRQKANSQGQQPQEQQQQQNFLLTTSPWSAKWAKDGILKIDLDRLREFPNELFAGVPDESLSEEKNKDEKLLKNGHNFSLPKN